ncbi:protein translocase subunit SecD [Phycicoccus endophyticus]|uniref:Protein translocase subunit SecD n=1 Tax=Phycicoccus endophyticus TaxID=1690220 RepID=A0A7G9R4P7_9MICO|nr:protein translocase subunit SecD [Phycicoccus endophyticus]NHI18479.1 protein translocase subunit SecD [Phycicoccus endophyticus]QNN50572.1 protein translocase subunit SecD [Phycicoccus endophyticus]GGL23469.1 protein translocase subunit SecD [Phycicoccus endophyticus]
MASAPRTVARRSLVALGVLALALGALLAGSVLWSDGQTTPKLGLDLEGGTQIILEPKTTGGQSVSAEQIEQARDIIVQRVDAGGVSGAEVTTQGDRNIVVSIPEIPSQAVRNAIKQSSQMQFRPVLAVTSGVPEPTETPSSSSSPTASGSASSSPTATASPAPSSSSTNNSALNEALTEDSPSPSTTASSSPSPSSSGDSDTPSDPTDLAWVTDKVQQAYQDLDCSDQKALDDLVDDPDKPLVTCSSDGSAKYILGPVAVSGDKISDATAGYQTNQQGTVTSTVEIALTFNSEGADEYADISRTMVGLEEPRNELATVLDSRVIVAPRFDSAIPNGRASITGGFTLESAKALADQLKFGALPLSFEEQSSVDISPTLGSEQLRYGFLAGLVGLLLVVVYSLGQYRMLGFVTISSILVAGLLTYLTITVLGWAQNYRLDMAGVTGLIVAIGFTADSFIVYFERVRDELREGRSLASAVETGWNRAKRTVLIADGVNLLAALVLYLLASSSVRGFAFTLGLTTVIDVLVVFWFTHPLLTLLTRVPFFRDGHRLSGLDPSRLGAKSMRYAGRGRFTPTPALRETEGSRA